MRDGCWCGVMRDCGADVRELLDNGHPMACVGDAVFVYVDIFTAHVNIGFSRAAELPGLDGLFEDTGRFIRYVML